MYAQFTWHPLHTALCLTQRKPLITFVEWMDCVLWVFRKEWMGGEN